MMDCQIRYGDNTNTAYETERLLFFFVLVTHYLLNHEATIVQSSCILLGLSSLNIQFRHAFNILWARLRETRMYYKEIS